MKRIDYLRNNDGGYDAAMKIFRDKEDYELEWAIQYLEKE
ncbi:hypothetical protein SAMN02910370_01665 [Lachnospiraceae bacterium XPB1003]|nr:hypothetical protein SAMN02910370_01665 [Lachnospiraceae bacterium XPB1003]